MTSPHLTQEAQSTRSSAVRVLQIPSDGSDERFSTRTYLHGEQVSVIIGEVYVSKRHRVLHGPHEPRIIDDDDRDEAKAKGKVEEWSMA